MIAMHNLTSVGKIIGDKNRLHILSLLMEGPKNVTELCNEVGHSQPNMSATLSVMRNGALVYPVRDGKSVVYHLNEDFEHFDVIELMVGKYRDIEGIGKPKSKPKSKPKQTSKNKHTKREHAPAVAMANADES